MSERLVAELPGILLWAIAGCLEWQKNGLQEPDEVHAATNEYRGEMDLVGQFLDDTCAYGAQMRVPCAALYAAYSRWCDDSGERPVTQRRFGAQLTERGIDRVRGAGGTRSYVGIGLVVKQSDTSDVSDVNFPISPREDFNDEIPETLSHLRHLRHSTQESFTDKDDPQPDATALIERLRAR